MEYYGVVHPDCGGFLRLRSTAKTNYARYYAFPAILRVDGKVLIAYKNGVSHGWEKEGAAVSLEQAVLDVASQRVERVDVLYAAEERIAQMGEYVRMHLNDGTKIVTLFRLKNMESTLPPEMFMRVHRSYIVNLKCVTGYTKGRIFLENDDYVPIGENYKEAFIKYIEKTV